MFQRRLKNWNISKLLAGAEIYIKRDDLTGIAKPATKSENWNS
jgi:1-aminocyclopropane-1-carboxylate deaminase/D-cysteine desulfhydrase-like pyridoxal-dependent ACC family enzyme